ncbi:MAG: hypothetical protein HUK03_10530, partial [Bacteroidaceae bacterium]|nr:hypothetical protein [Bacteroidaceae bacterium]
SETSKGACLTTDHKVEVEATDDGYRVITYAPTMKNFTSNNSTVFTLKLIADDTFEGGTITIANQLIATAGNEVSRPEDVSYTIEFIPPTGVTDVEEDKQGSQQYNLDGTPINQLQRGKIYIVNNKKVLVK